MFGVWGRTLSVRILWIIRRLCIGNAAFRSSHELAVHVYHSYTLLQNRNKDSSPVF